MSEGSFSLFDDDIRPSLCDGAPLLKLYATTYVLSIRKRTFFLCTDPHSLYAMTTYVFCLCESAQLLRHRMTEQLFANNSLSRVIV